MASFLNGIFGSTPSVPNLPTISLPGMQTQSIAANQAALPGAESLTSAANQFSEGQIASMLNFAVPGYSNMAGTASKNIQSMELGQIPGDVQSAIQESAAATSLGGGYGGSGMARDLVARDLGLTSLNLMDKGMQTAQSWIGQMASIEEPQMTNVAQSFITPMQEYQTTNEQNMQQFQRQWMANQVKAMPDPVMSGINNEVMSLMTSYLGGGHTFNGGWGGTGGQTPSVGDDMSDMSSGMDNADPSTFGGGDTGEGFTGDLDAGQGFSGADMGGFA
jgi:hypothetical protein